MKDWAKWLIRHKMRWTLYVLLILVVVPVLLIVACKNIPSLLVEIADWVRSDWAAIGREKP